ncbi:tubulin-folding cofactor B-like [Portunus trituberculatus]|uniref:tubulin-folding cofactor B-like n=1 Tax=Portunus trituberculatus TaxID=210409 RepID=UPI001E1CC88C|nr:tubulin-folding cofactor B-like [Portunus trituberculatus]
MEVQVNTAPLVNVRVTSNVNNFTAEKRFDRALTIGDLKGRLELVTGGSAENMTLEVFDEQERPVCSLVGDEALLGSFYVEENYRIHVTDKTRKLGEFDDTSNVEKYELPEDEYNKRNDSVRSFLLKNKLGKYNEEEMKKREEEKEKQEKEEEEKAKTISVGSRCEVRVQGEPTRRGEVMFVGKVHFKPGTWVGVRYDEPLGKNNGSIGGKRYFECAPKYGGFTRPACCEVGDFLPYDEEEEDEI